MSGQKTGEGEGKGRRLHLPDLEELLTSRPILNYGTLSSGSKDVVYDLWQGWYVS